MKSIQRYLFIPKLFFLFSGMFILGAQLGKLHAALCDTTPVSVSSESASWGLSFQTEGERPVGNASIEELRPYNAYYADDTNEKKIYLTFDCGYENGNTPLILDALKKHQAPAVFFVVGNFISDNPDLIKRIVSEGHIVGNHTVHHKSMPTLSDRDNKQEIIDCAEYCKEATGYEMDHFIRPPMGEYNEKTLKLTKSMGYKTIFWSMAYVDFDVNKQPGKQYVVEHFKKYTHNGAIPLMHNVSQSNAEALDEVITNLKKEGYQFESLKNLSSY